MSQIQLPRTSARGAPPIIEQATIQHGGPSDQRRIIFQGSSGSGISTAPPRVIPRATPVHKTDFSRQTFEQIFPAGHIPDLPSVQRDYLTTTEHAPRSEDLLDQTQPLLFGEARDDKVADEFRKQARQPAEQKTVFSVPQRAGRTQKQDSYKIVELGAKKMLYGELEEYKKKYEGRLSTFNKSTGLVFAKAYDYPFALLDFLTVLWDGSDPDFVEDIDFARADFINIVLQSNISNAEQLMVIFDLVHRFSFITNMTREIIVQSPQLSITFDPPSELSPRVKEILMGLINLIAYLDSVTCAGFMFSITALLLIEKDENKIIEKIKILEKQHRFMSDVYYTDQLSSGNIIRDAETYYPHKFRTNIWDAILLMPPDTASVNYENVVKNFIAQFPKILDSKYFWSELLRYKNKEQGYYPLHEKLASCIKYALKKVTSIPRIYLSEIHPDAKRIIEEEGYLIEGKKIVKVPGSLHKKDQKTSSQIKKYLHILSKNKALSVEQSVEFDKLVLNLKEEFYVAEQYMYLFNPFDEKSLYYDPFLQHLQEIDIICTSGTSKL